MQDDVHWTQLLTLNKQNIAQKTKQITGHKNYCQGVKEEQFTTLAENK